MKKTIQIIVLAMLCLRSRTNLYASITAVFLLTLIIALTANGVQGQETRQAGGITIGQQVPDVTINNIINYKTTSAKLSDFKGKLLILDFWATWCAPCIAMIPRMDSLQKQFEGKVQFLPVTYQPASVVEPFRAKLHEKKSISLPEVIGDKVLHDMFPHRSIPHYVWIDPDGKVIAITDYVEVTAERIKNVIAGNSQQLITKEEMPRVVYDPKKPLFTELNGGNGSSLKYHRLISNYADGLWPGYKFSGDSMGMKITVRNESLLSIYTLAYGQGQKFLNKNKVILEVKDPASFRSNLRGNDYLRWMREGNVFCYELIMPEVTSGSAFAAMREDLSLFFTNYQVAVERRNLPCIVLEASGKNSIISKGGKPLNQMSRSGATLQNGNWNHFIGRLDDYYLQDNELPLLDDTGISGFVDLEIKADMTDTESINRALIPYGLSLKPATRMIEVLVIKEKTGKGF
ncbi:TlpA family protein disulfide reductase [Daejeonella sp. JGW-45]|uniref:TlpA family protein disulfide reductase n=1 Tax=Daejeonella sp. JGW-45 TaxID=3034148 RepID=UPI0023ED2876|nr:TlpA family protein disulfide reductase [Daejeonella sp. JGW-45]